MLFDDSYITLSSESTSEYKDRGSRFIAYAFPVQNEDAFKLRLQELKTEHPDAVHHCWALILGPGREFQKFNDDREPANSAGRPILPALLAQNLTYAAIVVVRYFGGKLLGVPGLIAAYEGVAKQAVENGQCIQHTLTEHYRITVDYAHEHEAFRLIKQHNLRLIDHQQASDISIIFEVRKADADRIVSAFRANHHLKIQFHATPSGQ